jgi:hypothetical protein
MLKRNSLKEKIKEFLSNRQQGEDWVISAEIEQFAISCGYSGSNGSRRARELAQEGILERKHERGFSYYKIAKPAIQQKLVNTPPKKFYQEEQENWVAFFN